MRSFCFWFLAVVSLLLLHAGCDTVGPGGPPYQNYERVQSEGHGLTTKSEDTMHNLEPDLASPIRPPSMRRGAPAREELWLIERPERRGAPPGGSARASP